MKPIAVLFALVLSTCLLRPCPVRAAEETASLLIEANTGCILAEENAGALFDPGSFSKLMTAYLTAQAMERGEMSTESVLTAGESAAGMRGCGLVLAWVALVVLCGGLLAGACLLFARGCLP